MGRHEKGSRERMRTGEYSSEGLVVGGYREHEALG